MWYKFTGIVVTGIGIGICQNEFQDWSKSRLHRVVREWKGSFPAVYAKDKKETGQVVLVTGGSGFLGQHIIKQLQERAEFVREIRVLDLKPYTNNLGHAEKKPVKCVCGDVCELGTVKSAMKGVDAVIHAAAVVSSGLFPDVEHMQAVNVKGTENVVTACVSENVPHLVLTSTTDVVIGYDEIQNGDESLATPSRLLFSDFAETKVAAESLVTEAHGKQLAKGNGTLSTIILRPNVMYGELDESNVPNALKIAESRKGKLPVIGKGTALFQQAYVGNMAWAHVVALHALNRSPKTTGGQTYFIPDDTPVINTYAFMEQFLDMCGFALSNKASSYRLVYPLMFVTENVLKAIAPLYKVNLSTTLSNLTYMNRSYFFSREKAERLLGYQPLYTWNESFVMSADYYMSLGYNSPSS